ncbi:MAG: GNAT family N-acetyltransferase [Actinobacteria bacterium]|nr:GNAT family N-acetyltransferase [Actinomycetota bacterium]
MTGGTRVGSVTAKPDLKQLSRLVERDPIVHCFPASRLVPGSPPIPIWGYERDGELTSAVFAGLNMVPVETTTQAREEFASYAAVSPRRPSSIAGRQGEVLDLWQRIEPFWPPAREVRDSQPFLVATRQPELVPDPMVRPVRLTEADELLSACVAMFTEELGVSPLAGHGDIEYRRRVSDLIRQRRVFARFEGSRLVFKAELGAVSRSACQIQGVWVHPEHRGHGLAISGMAAVVQWARQQVPHVSLYVNEYNTTALHVYERAGFTRYDTFATILF